MRRLLSARLLTVFGLLVTGSACSDTSTSRQPSRPSSAVEGARLIVLEMDDYKFVPSALTAEVGETVTLRFINKGTVRHEAVIGDEAVQEAHAAMMMSMTTTTVVPRVTDPPARVAGAAIDVSSLTGRRSRSIRFHPGMNAPNVVSVEAGATGEVTYSLAKKAHLLIGCHEPGHYDMGMVATLDVV